MKYKYFRYMLFRSPRCYFWCTVGARYERAPNCSSPAHTRQKLIRYILGNRKSVRKMSQKVVNVNRKYIQRLEN